MLELVAVTEEVLGSVLTSVEGLEEGDEGETGREVSEEGRRECNMFELELEDLQQLW